MAPLETARAEDVRFLENRKYLPAFRGSRAGAAFVEARNGAARRPREWRLLVASDPYKSYALAAQAFYPVSPVIPGRAPSAMIDPEAAVPEDCEIGANVVIEAGRG